MKFLFQLYLCICMCVMGHNDKSYLLFWLTVTEMEKSLFPIVPAFPEADRQDSESASEQSGIILSASPYDTSVFSFMFNSMIFRNVLFF